MSQLQCGQVMSTNHLSDEDHQLFGFVAWAIGSGAVTSEEIREWALREVERREVPPVWMFDLFTFEGGLGNFLKIVGDGDPRNGTFHHRWMDAHGAALDGIAFKRFGPAQGYDRSISDKAAAAALRRHPEVERFFRDAFPFIEW